MTVLRSSVLPGFMRRTLLKGSFIAGLGVFLLSVSGTFLPPQSLQTWGMLLFLVGIAFITLGLLPYRRLKRLEDKPNTIGIEGIKWLHVTLNGKLCFSIPIDSIDRIAYIPSLDSSVQQATEMAAQAKVYGICIYLERPLSQKIIVQDPRFDFSNFSKKSLQAYGCDVFLPYFSPRTYLTLEQHLHAE